MSKHEQPNDGNEQQLPEPDPGNSPPEDWTEEMTPAEIDEVAALLEVKKEGEV